MIFFPVFPHLKFGLEANSIVSPKSYDKAGNDIDTCMNNLILENEIGDHFLDRLKKTFRLGETGVGWDKKVKTGL